MLDPRNFAITFGQALEIFRTRPDAIPEQKAALRRLVALTSLGPATVLLHEGRLSVSDTGIPDDLPGVRVLSRQMDAHGVREIRIAGGPPPADLLHLLRALAVNLGGYHDGSGVADRLAGHGVSAVVVVDEVGQAGEAGQTGRTGQDGEAEETVELAAAPPPSAPSPLSDPLEAALARLDDGFAESDVLDRATAVGQEVARALEADRLEEAAAALARVIRLEEGLPEGSPRRSLRIVLKRLLTPETLARLIDALFVPERRQDATAVLLRGRETAADQLMDRLMHADGMAERRVYFDVLRRMGDALEGVLRLLEHAEWPVVRNVAELAGEARVEAAVPGLGRLLRHEEPRVRRAAAVALARIGTPATADHLRRALREGDTEVRSLIAGAVAGRQSSALAMPLVLAADEETDAAVQREYFRALGRIGTADAVQALVRAAEPGGRFIGRKPAEVRIAAIDGLKMAEGPLARSTLEGLSRDRDRAVRDAARAALEALDAG